MNGIGIVLVLALALVGVLTVGRLVLRHFFAEPKPATPPVVLPCVHEWEPWSEPKDVGVKQQATKFNMYSGSVTTEIEFVGKSQERLCSKCNEYERRWA